MRRRTAGLTLRLLILLPAAAAVLALTAAPARAHALLERSDPLENARLQESPSVLTLSFTEPPEPDLSGVQVLDRSGSELQEGEAVVPPGDPGSLRLRVPELEEGVYTVVWRVVSRVDGHPTAGTFAFGVRTSPLQVGGPPVAPEALTPDPSPLEMAGRWGLFVGLGFLLGGAWVGALAFPRPPSSIVRLSLAAVLVAVAGLVALAFAQRQAAGASFGDLAGTELGRALIWRGLGILAAWCFLGLGLVERWRIPALAGAGLAAAVTMFVHVEAGHAAAAASLTWAQVLAQWAHFAAVGVWMGGLAALLLGVRGEPDEPKTRAVRRFSAVALFALAVVAVTGVVRAVDEVGEWGALFSTGYGRIVLVKAFLLLALLALGAVNRYRNVPAVRRSLRGLRRVSRAELGLAAGVLAAAAALAALVPPASVPEVQAAPAALTVTGSDFATSVRARLEVDPGVPGPNRFRLRLTDFDTGEPVSAQQVELRFAPAGISGFEPSALGLRAAGDGVYQGVGANLAAGGPWEVTALVQRAEGAVEIPLRVATLCETTEIPGPANLFTIDVVELPDGSSVQAYAEKAGGSRYQVHFTFIDPRGRAADIEDDPRLVASGPSGELQVLEPRPLARAHYYAGLTVEPGRWRFDGAARTTEGALLSGCLEQTFD